MGKLDLCLDRPLGVVLQDDAKVRLSRLSGDKFVGSLAIVDSKPVRDQAFDIDSAARDEVEKCFEITALGPANIAERIIVPAFLVFGIIAARSVGHRDLKAQFL